MKQVRVDFKETRFDWDCEPALERPGRFESEFTSRASPTIPRSPRKISVLSLTVAMAVVAGLVAIEMLIPLIRSLRA